MAEAKMNDAHNPYDPSLWVIDDSNAFTPDEVESFSLPKELKERMDALFDEVFELNNEVQSAA